MNILIVVDMQNDFVNGCLGTPEAREIVPAVVDELARYKAKDPVNRGRDFSNWANCQKMHFYNVLEQLTKAHELEDKFLKDKDGKYGA